MLSDIVACPADAGRLTTTSGGGTCTTCGTEYHRGRDGFLELITGDDPVGRIDTTSTDHGSEHTRARSYKSYLMPWLRSVDAHRVLDAGCGLGTIVMEALNDGYEPYGVDLPCLGPSWHDLDLDPDRFVSGNVTRLPFGDETFDAVISLGVIEHVGTVNGHSTLSPSWRTDRDAFARGLLRITKPGGRILLGGPNRAFPLDPQHGPHDEVRAAGRFRDAFFRRTGVNLHPMWGDYHLPSYGDVRRWFRGHEWRAMPLRDFFGFSVFQDPEGRPGAPSWLGRAAQRYVDGIPHRLRPTALNPWVLVEVTKSSTVASRYASRPAP